MNQLYTDLAQVYEEMYQSFIDYPAEYSFYQKVISQYDKNSVLEIGSGTGNLAALFTKNQTEYYGLDFSERMIEIAQTKVPTAHFLQGDMRDFDLKKKVESIIITGRTISYMVTNSDVQAVLQSCRKNLISGGILCFDFIDASEFMPAISPLKDVVHRASFGGNDYTRISNWQPKYINGMDFQWDSIYYKKVKNEWDELGQENSLVRTFTKDEIVLFLRVNGFAVKEVIARAAYAFPTYVVVAEKAA